MITLPEKSLRILLFFATLVLFVYLKPPFFFLLDLFFLFLAALSLYYSRISFLLQFSLYIALASLLLFVEINPNLLPVGDLSVYYRYSTVTPDFFQQPWVTEPLIKLLSLFPSLFQSSSLFFFLAALTIIFSYSLIAKLLSPVFAHNVSLCFLVLCLDRVPFLYESFWVLRQLLSSPFIVLACLARGKCRYFLIALAFLFHNSSFLFFGLYIITEYFICVLAPYIKRVFASLKIPYSSKFKLLRRFFFFIPIVFVFAIITLRFDSFTANFTGETLESEGKTLVFIIFIFISSLINILFRRSNSLGNACFRISCLAFLPSLFYIVSQFSPYLGLLSFRFSWFFYSVPGLWKLFIVTTPFSLLYPATKKLIHLPLYLVSLWVLLRFPAHVFSIQPFMGELKSIYFSRLLP